MASRATVYSSHKLNDLISIGDNFQILRPSLMRSRSLRSCSFGVTSSQYFSKMIPASTIAFPSPVRHQETFQPVPACRIPSPVQRLRGCTSCGQNNDFAGSGQVRNITLEIKLRFLFLCWRRQRDNPENARADAFGYRFYGAAFTGPVASLKHDADFQSFGDNPLLEFDQFNVKATKLFFILFCFQRGILTTSTATLVFLLLAMIVILRLSGRGKKRGRIKKCNSPELMD